MAYDSDKSAQGLLDIWRRWVVRHIVRGLDRPLMHHAHTAIFLPSLINLSKLGGANFDQQACQLLM